MLEMVIEAHADSVSAAWRTTGTQPGKDFVDSAFDVGNPRAK
ncbi:hypothetical protein [Mycobacterium sp.]|nr:hypothetical protein [Mycobacterium sp.]